MKYIKQFFNRIRQWKPFRAYVRQTLSAALLIIPFAIAVYEDLIPPILLWLIVPIYGLVDAAVKRINVNRLWDLWVDKK